MKRPDLDTLVVTSFSPRSLGLVKLIVLSYPACSGLVRDVVKRLLGRILGLC